MGKSSLSDSDRNYVIVVEALSHRREFGDIGELASFVQAVLDGRGGIFDPFELASISKLAELSNGRASNEIHRIARATQLHSPARSPRGPTPFDSKLAAAEERLVEAESARQSALDARRVAKAEYRRIVSRADAPGGSLDVVAAAAADRGVAASEVGVGVAFDANERALASKNALCLASQRWHSGQNMRYHNAADPSSPLTLAQLSELTAE